MMVCDDPSPSLLLKYVGGYNPAAAAGSVVVVISKVSDVQHDPQRPNSCFEVSIYLGLWFRA